MLLFRKVTTYTGHQDITDGSLSTTQAPPQIEQAIHTKDVTDTQYIYLYIYRRQSKDIRDIPQISHAICRSHSHSIEASQQFHVHTDITANPHTSKYIYKLKNRRASRALFFLLGCAKPRSYMVSTEIVVLVIVSSGRIAAFVPDSLERYWKRGRRKMRCGRRVASASRIYGFCCCRPSLRNRWLRQQIPLYRRK